VRYSLLLRATPPASDPHHTQEGPHAHSGRGRDVHTLCPVPVHTHIHTYTHTHTHDRTTERPTSKIGKPAERRKCRKVSIGRVPHIDNNPFIQSINQSVSQSLSPADIPPSSSFLSSPPLLLLPFTKNNRALFPPAHPTPSLGGAVPSPLIRISQAHSGAFLRRVSHARAADSPRRRSALRSKHTLEHTRRLLLASLEFPST
jgi:hypothetical protein